LSSARTRWGSCGPDGAIRLNWRLVHFPQQIIDYVVAHELAHLRELNHSPRFWDTVGQLFPDFDRARQWLRQFPDDMMAHGL
jgi:predicted metal-dependent hydrolase